jgi:uncharacterized protein YceH (UPF0502 family)
MDMSPEEIRVLGCLVEKERTTPDQYPLTTNALRLACNQKTNREPVVDYEERTVDRAMLGLRERKLARTVVGGGRTSKHKHVLGEAWGLSTEESAVLSVLAVRGPQTVAELRIRTERMADMGSVDAVQRVLDRLAARPEPLATCVGRRPGQKDERWAHLLAEEIDWPETTTFSSSSGPSSGSSGGRGGVAQRVEELEEEVRSLSSDLELLRRQFDQLCGQLGVDPS